MYGFHWLIIHTRLLVLKARSNLKTCLTFLVLKSQVVLSKIFYFYPDLRRWSNLTNIFKWVATNNEVASGLTWLSGRSIQGTAQQFPQSQFRTPSRNHLLMVQNTMLEEAPWNVFWIAFLSMFQRMFVCKLPWFLGPQKNHKENALLPSENAFQLCSNGSFSWVYLGWQPGRKDHGWDRWGFCW